MPKRGPPISPAGPTTGSALPSSTSRSPASGPASTYSLDPHWDAQVQLNASTRATGAATFINARDAFIQVQEQGVCRADRPAEDPFGFEVFREGDEVRPALERARVFAEIFPDERDIGIVAETTPHSTRAPRFALGVVNGDGINRMDSDTSKSVAGKVELPIGKFNVIGASFYNGTTTGAKPSTTTKFFSRVKNTYGSSTA